MSQFCLEGNPFIIRFKTQSSNYTRMYFSRSLEGNPFIIRFKTTTEKLERKIPIHNV